MPSRIGRARSKADRFPPTMIESLPSSNVMTLPDTGASSICAPLDSTCLASSRLVDGLTVLMSM